MSRTSSFERENVSGFLHEPASGSRGGLALTHGAGGNCNARLLVAIAEAFCATGWTVLRYDLPFRRQRASGPPSRYSAELDQAGIRAAVDDLRGLTEGPMVASGHSYGGRQTTMLAAKQPDLCDALLCFSYPLHPPNKPDQLRTAHFPQLWKPALFVHGSTDPFGSSTELQAAIELIPSKAKLVIVEGAGHDLKGGKINVERLVGRELEGLIA